MLSLPMLLLLAALLITLASMLGEHCFEFALGITAWDEWFLKINKISPV